MLKKFLFTIFLACFALSANAQIATPLLDSGFKSYGGAAAGWRYGSTINLIGIIAEGKIEEDGNEAGDVVAGLNAKGPEDSSNPVPFMLAAYRGETFAVELFTNLGDGIKTDVEFDESLPSFNKKNIYREEKELRMNLAYVLGETFSIGLGYANEIDKEKTEFANTSVLELEQEAEVTTVGTSLTGSFRLADIFFVAAGMETVKQTGTFKRDIAVDISSIYTNFDGDYVENSWTNTMFGVGIVTGDPDETQFRVEYSMISSPESEEKDDTGVEKDSVHPKTTTTFISAEAKFGSFLVGYLNETEKEAELNDVETETVTTSTGIGWKPMEGFTMSVYLLDKKKMKTNTSSDSESIVNPKGYRILIGYNF